jgi:hypothetical protein
MGIRYYPLSRILPNLYTRGDEYLDPNGKPYSGRYYLTYDNKAYSGISPINGTNQPLRRITAGSIASNAVRTPAGNTYAALSLQKTPANPQESIDVELRELKPYYPIPLQSDYSRGYFTRYFAKNVTGPGYIVEISQNDWSKIQNGDISEDVLAYETINMLWQLTGPLHDTRVSQYQIIGGVYDTNKRVTEAKAKGFNGLLNFIDGEYTKFAKITP